MAVLTVQEFTFDLDEFDEDGIPSMERICRTFMDDANRGLVWWIRFGALKAWRINPDVIARSTSDSGILRDACEVAASFPSMRCGSSMRRTSVEHSMEWR
jgi:hypothetical protein